jgi:hypothetical protein
VILHIPRFKANTLFNIFQNEDADDWSYKAGLAGGWIPYDPSERQCGNVCGF